MASGSYTYTYLWKQQASLVVCLKCHKINLLYWRLALYICCIKSVLDIDLPDEHLMLAASLPHFTCQNDSKLNCRSLMTFYLSDVNVARPHRDCFFIGIYGIKPPVSSARDDNNHPIWSRCGKWSGWNRYEKSV